MRDPTTPLVTSVPPAVPPERPTLGRRLSPPRPFKQPNQACPAASPTQGFRGRLPTGATSPLVTAAEALLLVRQPLRRTQTSR